MFLWNVVPWHRSQTPTLGRSLLLLSLFCGLLVSQEVQAGSLKEKDVIRLAHEQDPSVLQAGAQVSLAEVGREVASLHPNPTLTWDREAIVAQGPRGEEEDVFVLSVPIQLSSRRRTTGYLAEVEVARSQSQVAVTRNRAALLALGVLYRLVAVQEEVAIEKRSVQRLSLAAAIVKKRKLEGHASGYDQMRLKIEKELASSTLRQTVAKEGQLAERLALLLGVDPKGTSFSASLRRLKPDSGAKSSEGREAPSLAYLHAAQSSAKQASESAKNGWFPTITVSGGPKIASTDETRYGYAGGISLSLPFFSHGQANQARARAVGVTIQREIGVTSRLRSQRRANASYRLAAAERELLAFKEGTVTPVDRLLRATESGYREGRRTIIELVDSQRVGIEVKRRYLSLRLAAKMAEISRRAAQGEFE